MSSGNVTLHPVYNFSLGMTKAVNKIIVALDVATNKEALGLVEQLRNQVSLFKVGLQLYTAEGPAVVREVISRGAQVFLDLKLHDIPNTVAKAVEAAAGLGVEMLTIHLSGGPEMVRAAVAADKEKMSILGVTVLTSANEQTLRETGVPGAVEDQVLRLAKLGLEAGVDGIVASAREIEGLRRELGDKFKIVVPGIRPAGSDAADQKRTMTPREAINAGADFLVIGRPIIADKNPREALDRILDELK